MPRAITSTTSIIIVNLGLKERKFSIAAHVAAELVDTGLVARVLTMHLVYALLVSVVFGANVLLQARL